jgi:hypothetical protein
VRARFVVPICVDDRELPLRKTSLTLAVALRLRLPKVRRN